MNADEIAEMAIDCLQKKKPLSLIRVGDGEGLILDWRRYYRDRKGKTAQEWRSLRCQLLKWFGRDNYPGRELDRMRMSIVKAISRCDILGAPNLQSGGLWTKARDCLDRMNVQVASSHNCHIHLQKTGALWRIISAAESIAVVTCRTELRGRLENRLGVPVELVQIPDGTRSPTSCFERRDTHHWDDQERYRKACFRTRSALVLVGAGLLGKLYTTDAARGGSVAIDIGSIFDGWAGLQTRSYLLDEPERYSFDQSSLESSDSSGGTM